MLQLFFAATILLAGATSDVDSTLLTRLTLPSEDKLYGGLSALEIDSTGTRLTALSDRGQILTGTIDRDAEDRIVRVTLDAPQDLNTRTFDFPGATNDAEGLAIAPDGTIYVSFEGIGRVGRFGTLDGAEIAIPRPRDFEGLQGNAGLEALAIDAQGRLYTMPERSGRYDAPFPVYRYDGSAWSQPFAIPRTGSYLIVGADFGPDGRMYILERDFSGIGFHTRVRRIDLEAKTATTVLETGIGMHGNMEGIAVWANTAGETIITLIADDNFRRFLTNEVAEYRIDG